MTAYRETLKARIARNLRRLEHGQDGRGNVLTPVQEKLLAIAVRADELDLWEGSTTATGT